MLLVLMGFSVTYFLSNLRPSFRAKTACLDDRKNSFGRGIESVLWLKSLGIESILCLDLLPDWQQREGVEAGQVKAPFFGFWVDEIPPKLESPVGWNESGAGVWESIWLLSEPSAKDFSSSNWKKAVHRRGSKEFRFSFHYRVWSWWTCYERSSAFTL